MALGKYKEKRDFKKTPEPAGKRKKNDKKLLFVVQKHDATRLHYDFRIELDGVLKSWAIPKGPSMNPEDKRLAMMVEDHPYDYKDFEGIIPKGNYGAGTVIVWDEGTYRSAETGDDKEGIKKIREGLKKGDLKIILNGKKLKGEFALVHMKSSKDDNAWLMIKKRDKFATEVDITKKDKSVKSNKTIEQIERAGAKGSEDPPAKSTRKKKSSTKNIEEEGDSDPFPHKLIPMLAKLTGKPFDDPDWIFEIKWDGYRAIAEIENGSVHIHSRNLLSFDEKFSSIKDSLSSIERDAVFDGEIVAVDEEGNIRFQNLQNYWRNGKPVQLIYYVFDLLYYNGKNLMKQPLIKRKEILKDILPGLQHIKYSDHILKDGVDFFKAAKEKKLEGIMAKESNSHYYPGKRTSNWLKIKTELRQEVIIAGFTEPRGSRKNFGALILGVYDNDKLRYVGHTGTGFDNESLRNTMKKLKPMIVKNSPFSEKIKTNAKVTWVKPSLLAEVKFSEWTDSGSMRHPVFLGLREDKKARDVTYELPQNGHFKKNSGKKKKVTANSPGKGTKNKIIKAGKFNVEISNPGKIYWPDEKIKKIQLVEYYNEIGDTMLPYLKNRPQSLNRFPEGIKGENFFQKDIDYNVPEYVDKVIIKSKSSEKGIINYLLCQNKASLLYLANLGCIEINPWNSRIQSLENPDYIIIDIDPADEDFNKVIEVALAVKEVLDKAGIKGYCKTSGASGMHVYIPMNARYDYDIARNFAQLISQFVHNLLPGISSVERSVSKRNKKIYVDFLQNRKGQTLAAAYSVRPKPGATVSTPLEWKEVKNSLHPSDFTIFNTAKRLQKKGDLFKGVLGKGVDIVKAVKKLEGGG